MQSNPWKQSAPHYTVMYYVSAHAYAGCLPQTFVPASPLDQQLEVDCSQIHPTLRGRMQWKCASDRTWIRDLSGCTFTDNATNSLTLLSYRICSNISKVQVELETIQKQVSKYAKNRHYARKVIDSDSLILLWTIEHTMNTCQFNATFRPSRASSGIQKQFTNTNTVFVCLTKPVMGETLH